MAARVRCVELPRGAGLGYTTTRGFMGTGLAVAVESRSERAMSSSEHGWLVWLDKLSPIPHEAGPNGAGNYHAVHSSDNDSLSDLLLTFEHLKDVARSPRGAWRLLLVTRHEC